jgi:uncharacterized coiled-coil protein SlyX
LTWEVSNANSCKASDGWTGDKNTNGGSQLIEKITGKIEDLPTEILEYLSAQGLNDFTIIEAISRIYTLLLKEGNTLSSPEIAIIRDEIEKETGSLKSRISNLETNKANQIDLINTDKKIELLEINKVDKTEFLASQQIVLDLDDKHKELKVEIKKVDDKTEENKKNILDLTNKNDELKVEIKKDILEIDKRIINLEPRVKKNEEEIVEFSEIDYDEIFDSKNYKEDSEIEIESESFQEKSE